TSSKVWPSCAETALSSMLSVTTPMRRDSFRSVVPHPPTPSPKAGEGEADVSFPAPPRPPRGGGLGGEGRSSETQAKGRAAVSAPGVGLLEAGLVLAAEVAEGAQHGIGGRLAQAAQTGLSHHRTELLQKRQVGGAAVALGDPVQEAVHLNRPGAAGDALAAR